MLRSVFVGYDSPLGRVVAHWLSEHTILAGCLWIPPSARWFKSWKGRLEFTRGRIRRRGLLRACDEAAFRLHYSISTRLSKNDRASKQLIAAYWSEHEPRDCGNELSVKLVNECSSLLHVRTLQPDIIFSHCIHQFFSTELRSIPKIGTFMWHTGIMPQYRGLYSPFWALHNVDLGNIGYSLFRVSEVLDGGDVYVQGRITNVDVLRDNHTHIAHKAMFASFTDVARFIDDVECGTAHPLASMGAASHYYSYPGITDYLRQRRRIKQFLERQNATLRSMQEPP